MSEIGPRRLAIVGVIAAVGGGAVHLVVALSHGGGMSGYHVAQLPAGYVFYGSVSLIAVGALIAGAAQRIGGVALMLVAALFHVGFTLGSQVSLRLLVIP